MADPIRDDEVEALFGETLRPFSSLLIAVSGGVDSTALMQLIARWREGLGADARPAVLVATFDHGLRKESAAEATWVRERAADLGLEHRVLVWDGAKPRSGVQAAARRARYDALGRLGLEWSGDRRPCAIVTAHHLEDQAETVLMRLARGSGPDGLAGMSPVRWIEPKQLAIMRPLLGVPKARLVATLVAAGADWCEDPSNESRAFERVRMRQAAAVLGEVGIDAASLGLSARRAARARDALNAGVATAESRVLAVNDGAFARLSRAGFARLPEELRVRMLGRVLFAFGGQEEPPQLAQLETLVGELAGAGKGWRTTLGGCLISVVARAIVVHRESGRQPMPAVMVKPGETILWDRRFMVSLPARARHGVRVEGLSVVAARDLARRCAGMPSAAAGTLPVQWENGRDGSGTGAAAGAVRVVFTFPRIAWG